jgi:hypothetical protein
MDALKYLGERLFFCLLLRLIHMVKAHCRLGIGKADELNEFLVSVVARLGTWLNQLVKNREDKGLPLILLSHNDLLIGWGAVTW